MVGDRELRHVRQQQADARAGADPGRGEMAREAARLLVQLGVRERLLAQPQRDAGAVAPRALVEQRREVEAHQCPSPPAIPQKRLSKCNIGAPARTRTE